MTQPLNSRAGFIMTKGTLKDKLIKGIGGIMPVTE